MKLMNQWQSRNLKRSLSKLEKSGICFTLRYVVFDTREIDIFVNTTNARTQVHHRTGIVPVRETSIVIAVSSAHRKESLEAVHYLIDTIKATVPVEERNLFGRNIMEGQCRR